MKYTLTLCGIFLGTMVAHGQIRMKLTTNRKAYLPYETILLTVLIENNTGNTLKFPKAGDKLEEGYISCYVKDEQGLRARSTVITRKRFGKSGKANFAQGLVLPAGVQRKMTIPITRYYAMDKPQNYTFEVRVSHKRLSKDYVSQPASIDVIPGVTILSMQTGIPSEEGVIAKRKCSLVSFHAQKTNKYALRVEDKQNVYCVYRLSSHMGGDLPQMKIDARSQIHIVIHTGAQEFRYWLFDINGKLKQTVLYEYSRRLGIPNLLRDPDIGRVRVVGGRRIVPGQEADVRLPPLERKLKD